MRRKGHAIFCNDSIQLVVAIGEETAKVWLADMKNEHFADDPYHKTIEEYSKAYYWHIHEVDVIV